MASGFPGSIDNFTDPTSTSALNSPSHSGQHADLNDAIEKIETYMGLVKVIPTSVTGGTLSATGTVTVSSNTATLIIGGCFSSLYDNYRILVNGLKVSSLGTLCFYLGTNSASGLFYGSSYYDQYTGSSTGTNRRNGGNNAYLGLSDTGGENGGYSFDLNAPNLAKQKTYHGTYDGRNYAGWFGGLIADSTQYTGITFLNDAGNISNLSLRIYGYRN
jgi:hypothetical protein